MRLIIGLILLLSFVASASVSPVPVPAATVNGITVGGGYLESYSHQVWRTAANAVYIVAIDDNPCQVGGQGVIRMWKGTGQQPTNILVPTGFSEMDAAHHPAAANSGTCVYAVGYASTLGSPDSRMDKSGVIHVAYTQATSASAGTVYYITYDTTTDLWGARVQIATDAYITPGADWPRVGRTALTLDANDIPHLVYIGSNSVKYTNRIGGAWAAVSTIYASSLPNNNPSIVTAADGSLHLAWIDAAASAHAIVKWAKYVLGAGWSAVETVDNGNVLANGDDDQGPSVTVDSQGRPHVLYLYGTVNGSDNYVRLRYRAANGTWTDNTPAGAAGPSNPNGTWFCHTPQNYMTATDDEFVFLAHDANMSPGVYQYQVGGADNNWSAVFQMDPRNSSNSPPGGIDGSAVTRYDPLRDTNPQIIDLLYYDESDGTAGYNHHSTVYYKAVALNNTPDTIAPSVPTNLSAVPTSSAQISLSWTPSTDNVGVAGYKVFRNGTQIATTTTAGYGDTGLASSTMYTYAVSAFDAAGNVSDQSSAAVATTLAPDTTAPSVPADLAATPVSSSAIDLSWSPSMDDTRVSGYRVFRNGVQIATTGTTAFSDSGLLPGTTYTYAVSAYDAAGNVSAQSAPASATTRAAAPVTYTLFGSGAPVTADYGSDSSIEVGVKFTSDVAGQIVAIRFYKSALNTGTHTVALWSSTGTLLASGTATGETASGWQTVLLSSPVTISAKTTYVASYHAPSAHYASDRNYFAVQYDKAPLHAPVNAGVYAYGTARVFPSQTRRSTNYWVDVALLVDGSAADTAAPSVPTGLAATPVSSSAINLTWTAATDNVGVTGYAVYRGGNQIGTTATTSYSDTGLAASSTYTYTVSAYDAAGNMSAQSASASATTQAAADTTPPSLSGIIVSSVTASSAIVAWTTNEPADTQVDYGVSTSYGSSTALNTALVTAHTAAISGLSAATVYHYRVKSRDAAGNLSVSGDYSFTTSALPDVTPPTAAVTSPQNSATVSGIVSVSASASDDVKVTKVEFYLDGVLQATTTSSPYTWSFNTSQATNGTHSLQVKAYDAAGNIGTSPAITVTVSNVAGAPIALVQSASGNIASSAQISISLPAPVTGGDLLVIAVSSWPSAPAATAITDSVGNAYSIAGATRQTAGGAYTGIYYAKNVKGGADTVVFRTASGGAELSMVVAEFSGANAASPLDAAGGSTGSGTTASSGNLTPTAAGDLVVGAGTHDATNTTKAGSGFTMIAVTNEDAFAYQPLAMDYKIQTTTSATAATLALTISDRWAQAGALFKR